MTTVDRDWKLIGTFQARIVSPPSACEIRVAGPLLKIQQLLRSGIRDSFTCSYDAKLRAIDCFMLGRVPKLTRGKSTFSREGDSEERFRTSIRGYEHHADFPSTRVKTECYADGEQRLWRIFLPDGLEIEGAHMHQKKSDTIKRGHSQLVVKDQPEILDGGRIGLAMFGVHKLLDQLTEGERRELARIVTRHYG